MSMINAARRARHDINIICIYHTEKADDGNLKLKTVGKMIDNTVFLDGIFTVILYGEVINDYSTNTMSYRFRTHSNGTSTCKSPVGMFDNDIIPNDMGYVVDKINAYYNG